MTSSVLICMTCLFGVVFGNWQDWWTYNGISGPAYWGLINPAWTMCNKGRKQSPINIDPKQLIYDSKLTNVMVDKHRVNGHITNTGQSLVFRMEQGQIPVNITGGPLAYKYQFQEMFFHFGVSDAGGGSEHTVNGVSFPAEIQLLGFNAHLYTNLSQATEYPGGVAAVSVMAHLKGERPGRGGGSKRHEGLGLVASKLQHVKHRGQSTRVHHLSLADILPSTSDYVTYEGSTTFPGCWETTTWIIMNKPIYMSKQELDMFYQLRQGDRVHEKAPLGNNVRPIQPLNSRSLRTNIALPASKPGHKKCHHEGSEITYKANSWVVSTPKNLPNP